jgi:glycosyltransferase involved in cell wall biosynthesis
MLLLARPRKARPIPVVLSFHGADLNAARNAGWADRRLWNAMIGRCDAAVACSQALAKEFLEIFPAARDKLHVILNGIDGDACRRASRAGALPAALEGRRYLANLGTFEHKKGQDVLLAAFRRIAAVHPDLHLALAGRSGPALAALQAAAREDALRGRVHIFVDQSHAEAMAILSRAELMLHPARQEPFGLVILEAASLDVPVIATGIGGIPEIIEDRRSGRLVPADDAEALTTAALEALADPATTRGYAAVLRKEAEDRFSWTRAADAYAKLFRTPLEPSGSGAGRHSGH